MESSVWRRSGALWRVLAVLGLVVAPVVPVGVACFWLCFPLFYDRASGLPDDHQWSVLLAEALAIALVPTAFLVFCWLNMVRSGRWGPIWGSGVGLAWAIPIIPAMALSSIHEVARLYVDGLADPYFAGQWLVFVVVGVSQVWVAWRGAFPTVHGGRA